MSLDLFGGDTPIVEKHPGMESIMSRWIRLAGYRKANGEERQCKNCREFEVKLYSGTYFKCSRLGDTHCSARDIRAHHVCKFHKYCQE